MAWVFAILLGVLAFAGIAMLTRPRGKGWEAVATALLLGTAGYAMQGRPDLAGAPRAAHRTTMENPALLVDVRQEFTGGAAENSSKWLVIADAMVRHGQFSEASNVLLGAVKHSPGDSEAWLAMGNALVAHADGTLTPAALNAYRNAARADPKAPGPPFFLGLGLAQSGRFAEARALWAGILADAPADAPWREGLELRLARLDALLGSGADGSSGR